MCKKWRAFVSHTTKPTHVFISLEGTLCVCEKKGPSSIWSINSFPKCLSHSFTHACLFPRKILKTAMQVANYKLIVAI